MQALPGPHQGGTVTHSWEGAHRYGARPGAPLGPTLERGVPRAPGFETSGVPKAEETETLLLKVSWTDPLTPGPRTKAAG